MKHRLQLSAREISEATGIHPRTLVRRKSQRQLRSDESDLNTAKFKVIHELENWLPAALFRYEWESCEQGKGKAYKPITHLERFIPLTFAVVYLALSGYALLWQQSPQTVEPQPVTVNGTVDVNVKSPWPAQPQTQAVPNPPQLVSWLISSTYRPYVPHPGCSRCKCIPKSLHPERDRPLA